MSLESHWCPEKSFIRHHHLDAAVLSWLVNQGSMTAKMKRFSPQVLVQVLSHKTRLLTLDEALYIGGALKQRATVREVVMKVGGQDWLYAQTLLPLSLRVGDAARLSRPTHVPLGKTLFRLPKVVRSEFELAFLPCEMTGQPELSRRSHFKLAQGKVALKEVFLPAMIAAIRGEHVG